MHSIACHARAEGSRSLQSKQKGERRLDDENFWKTGFWLDVLRLVDGGRMKNMVWFTFPLITATPAARIGVQCNRNKVVLVFWSFGVNVINILQVKYSTIYLTG